ncbi:aspartate/glutamate racemase family protein [Herbaspirillum frisingense]|uniref:aspartate/glutamate racemase family protein n=1 Tax=Herbaspirillum frisingense TaxID=92645 RepID=UPI0016032B33|nr:aspartate/glutamate racemase family protein [Herbaspirillum frisingense]QNB05552.1 aspartate/glutamate racemase family protein [Herbaspirillum frisingense]
MLGIVMLDTVFPRPLGDIGNPATFPFPTRLHKVSRASPQKVIFERASGMVDDFVQAARDLESQGCKAIVTSCGFLALHQQIIAAAVQVPFASSSLCWLPTLYLAFGGARHVGILTASSANLGPAHLAVLGGSMDSPIAGMPVDSEFARVIVGNQPQGDMQRIHAEMLALADDLVATQPQVRAILLECTNMPPVAQAIAQRTGRPVFDLVGLARQLMA